MTLIFDCANFGDDETNVLLYEFKGHLNKYLAKAKIHHKNPGRLIKFNESNKTQGNCRFSGRSYLFSRGQKVI